MPAASKRDRSGKSTTTAAAAPGPDHTEITMDDDSAQNEPTMASLLRAADPNSTGGDAVHESKGADAALGDTSSSMLAAGSGIDAWTGQSQTTLLMQALKTDDTALIHELVNTLPSTSVVATVGPLPSLAVLPLLTKLSDSFEKYPGETENNLIVWIRALLISHASYLMAQTNLHPAINKLYQIIDSRVAVYKKMSKLMGRLDLVLEQASNTLTSSLLVSHPAIYNEDVEADADEDIKDEYIHTIPISDHDDSESDLMDEEDSVFMDN